MLLNFNYSVNVKMLKINGKLQRVQIHFCELYYNVPFHLALNLVLKTTELEQPLIYCTLNYGYTSSIYKAYD